jgi:YbbR domain-containing protein
MAHGIGDFFRNYVFKNLPFKIVSLAIAVLLWWVVGRDQPVEMPLTVPLEFVNAPANLDINSDYPLQARVTLRGPQRQLQNLNASEIHALVNTRGAEPGERTYDLTADNIRAPRNVRVVQIVPAQIHVTFDRSVERAVRVQPRVIGTLVSGYSIRQVKAQPGTITILGPARRVNAIDTAMTDPVDATGVVGSGVFTTHAYVADPLVRVQSPEPIHVTVETEKVSRGAGQP